VVFVFLFGCEFTPPGKPWTYPTTAVVGRITISGQPIERGWVTLLPAGNTVGDHIVVRLVPDGTFRTSEAPIGLLQVRLEFPADFVRKHPRMNRFFDAIGGINSPLRFTSKPATDNRFDFDLIYGLASAKE
jgi:hypothetical protein